MLTPWPCWVLELQRWKKRKNEGETTKRKVTCRGMGGWLSRRRMKVEGRGAWGWGEGLKLLAVGGIVSLGLILSVLQCLFVLFFTFSLHI